MEFLFSIRTLLYICLVLRRIENLILFVLLAYAIENAFLAGGKYRLGAGRIKNR